ncbi:GNAT family N-acetyltransferase [Vreelandella nanhaiensis]|uniref:GNAT family N-acetyltransferase n=1 Tax=Vreelandella nanhaiensis TaxID=1258546 RepID=A0A3S0XYY5_9GAMM|nr:GNAT family N-acetyltransferase [Halomonas nanhaiensis]RUR33633.1 GNAT family N-acetyltransferase [Halomonas nanhaiensis]
MTPLIRPTNDKRFAEQLIRQNMSSYHEQLDMHWSSALFDSEWRTLESYQLIINTCPAGLLCINQDAQALYIRELQIVPKWQRQGLGTAAIRYTMDRARQADIDTLRLRVFCINPAAALYERMGFHVRKTENNTHYMERRIV